jgi:hypothetical protein
LARRYFAPAISVEDNFLLLAASRPGAFALNASQKLLDYIVTAGHLKQQRFGAGKQNEPPHVGSYDYQARS